MNDTIVEVYSELSRHAGESSIKARVGVTLLKPNQKPESIKIEGNTRGTDRMGKGNARLSIKVHKRNFTKRKSA